MSEPQSPPSRSVLTPERILSWGPCWPDESVRAALAPLGSSFTVLDVLTKAAGIPDVTADDRLWVVLRDEVLPLRVLRLFAVGCARRALEAERVRGRPPDLRSLAACDVAERLGEEEVYGLKWEAARSSAREAVDALAQSAMSPARRAAGWASRGAHEAALLALDFSAESAATTTAAREVQAAVWAAASQSAPDQSTGPDAQVSAATSAVSEQQIASLVSLLGGAPS